MPDARYGCENMVAKLERVLVRRPEEAGCAHWLEYGWRSAPDFAKLLHEQNHLPVYYFPESEVRMDLLEPTDHSTRCPFKGEASYWSVRVGDGDLRPLVQNPVYPSVRQISYEVLESLRQQQDRLQ